MIKSTIKENNKEIVVFEGNTGIFIDFSMNDFYSYQLTKSTMYAINEQQNLHKYQETETYIKKGSMIYSVFSKIYKFGKWFI